MARPRKLASISVDDLQPKAPSRARGARAKTQPELPIPEVEAAAETQANQSPITLSQYVDAEGPVLEDRAVSLLLDLLSALVVAHGEGVFHPHMTPDSVLLEESGGYVLADMSGDNHSDAFLAPEQRHEGELDAQTDLWRAGMTTWWACTGLASDQFENLLHTDGDHYYGVTRLCRVVPGFSTEFEQMLMTLLAWKKENRPAKAAEALANLREAKGIVAPEQVEKETEAAPPVSDAEKVLNSLSDPRWAEVCRDPEIAQRLTPFQDGAYLSRALEPTGRAFILLSGKVVVERDGAPVAQEDREGVFVGELNASDVRASGDAWVLAFDAPEFEQFLATNPAIAIRLIRRLADR